MYALPNLTHSSPSAATMPRDTHCQVNNNGTVGTESRHEEILRAATELDAAHRENVANARARLLPLADGSWVAASTVGGLSERAQAFGQARRKWAEIRDGGEVAGPWQAWANWERSAARFRRAEREMYPEGLNDRVAAVATGEPEAVEWALTFLEVDPWCFRSGYLKVRLLRKVANLDLGAAAAPRLRALIVRVGLTPRSRNELKAYVTLARRLDSPELQDALRRAQDNDSARSERATAILHALGDGWS